MRPLIWAFLLASSTALAAKNDKAAPEGKPPRRTSAEERDGKQYTVDFQPVTPFVGTVSPGVTSGASFGAFVRPDLIARFTARGGSSCAGGRCAYVERTVSFTAQKFLTNSFFIEPGLGIQRIIYHPEDRDPFAGEKRKYHFTYNVENWGALFGLGNQWQWGAFTLGARWVSAFQSVFSREAKIHEDSPKSFQKDDQEKAQLRDLQDETKLYLASLALGWSF